VYTHAEELRDSGRSAAEVSAYIYPELARIRKLIQTMPLLPEFEKELAKRMRDTFGPDGTYGVFVRSDTNAEDLPGIHWRRPESHGAESSGLSKYHAVSKGRLGLAV
jgi:hypothetical protein